MRYQKPIKVEKVSSRLYRILEDTPIFGVVIPKGFETDGASVPKPFWWVISPFAEGFRAAIVHDFRYRLDASMTRKEADTEFYYNLDKDDVHCISRLLVYWAVRLFGWRYFALENCQRCNKF